MDGSSSKIHSHSRHVQAAVNQQVVNFQSKNDGLKFTHCIKAEQTRTKEDKKSHEFGTVSLLYSEKETKAPKSIAVHSFDRNLDLRFIAKSGELFSRYVKMQNQMMNHEIKTEREMKYTEAHWRSIKKIFHEKLHELNQKKQQKEI